MYMVAVVAGCQMAMVGTEWANSCSDSMDRLRKHYSHFLGVHFWQERLLEL